MKVVVLYCLVAVTMAQELSLSAINADHGGYGSGSYSAAQDCPPEWLSFGSRCIWTSRNERRNYASAGEYCSTELNARLLTITATTQASLNSLINSHNLLYFVGVTRVNSIYYGSDGASVSQSDLSLESSQSHITESNVSCLVLSAERMFHGHFVHCSEQFDYICERDKYPKCTTEDNLRCQMYYGSESECRREVNHIGQSYFDCQCKSGYELSITGICAAKEVFTKPADHVNCTDPTGRNLFIFNNGTYSSTLKSFSAAKSVCAAFGAELLTREQADLSCVSTHRLNHLRFDRQSSAFDADNAPPMWIQDHRDGCSVIDSGGVQRKGCTTTGRFLCAKPLTTSYHCNMAGKLLSYIMPPDLTNARTTCLAMNGKVPAATTNLLAVVSRQDINAFPELLPCMRAALYTLQPTTTIQQPATKVIVDDSNACTYYDFEQNRLFNCTTDATRGAVSFCIRDAQKTHVTDAKEYFHPLGDARFASLRFAEADRLCKAANGSLADASGVDLVHVQAAIRHLMHFVPQYSGEDLPTAGRYVWSSISSASSSNCSISYLGRYIQSDEGRLHDSCVALNAFLCEKAVTTRPLYSCGRYNYTHPSDLQYARLPYNLAKAECTKMGATLPAVSVIFDTDVDLKCLMNAITELQHPIPFIKPVLEDLHLWLENTTGKSQTVFNTSTSYSSTVSRTTAHRFMCVYVSPTDDSVNITVPDCAQGFERLSESSNCADINECDESPCTAYASCNNTNGSYMCSCRAGFTRSNAFNNGTLQCANINECANTPCNTNEMCRDTTGSYECVCNSGYSRASSDMPCSNTNECAGTLNPCLPGNRICEDTQGSFSCSCPMGYMLNGTGSRYCVNMDECSGASNCPANTVCRDSIGSYSCLCKSGFKNSSTGCRDVDECGLASTVCHVHAMCSNTDGSYTCTCRSGYTGTGLICSNINECNATDSATLNLVNSTCGNFSGCVDTEGSFACPCVANYSGDILCPTIEREVDNVVLTSRKPSTFTDPLILSGIAAGGVLLILAIVIIVRVSRSRSAKRATITAQQQAQAGIKRASITNDFNI